MSLCLSYTHPPSTTSFLVACRRLAVHTSLVFSSQQNLKWTPITLLVSAPHTLFSHFKTFPAIPANSLSRSSMEMMMSSTKPSTSAQNRTEKQTDPEGTCESHRAFLLCIPLLSSLVQCRCCDDLALLVSMDTFAVHCAHFYTTISFRYKRLTADNIPSENGQRHFHHIHACWPVTALSLSAEPKRMAVMV